MPSHRLSTRGARTVSVRRHTAVFQFQSVLCSHLVVKLQLPRLFGGSFLKRLALRLPPTWSGCGWTSFESESEGVSRWPRPVLLCALVPSPHLVWGLGSHLGLLLLLLLLLTSRPPPTWRPHLVAEVSFL